MCTHGLDSLQICCVRCIGTALLAEMHGDCHVRQTAADSFFVLPSRCTAAFQMFLTHRQCCCWLPWLLLLQVSQLQEEISQGRGPPHVAYMHFSPPCQDLSRAKPSKLRCFTGSTFMCVVAVLAVWWGLRMCWGVAWHSGCRQGRGGRARW